jgi:death on curing protein
MSTVYLTLDEVLRVHAHQIATYGGSPGIRDVGLLESALAMPETTAFGEDLHPTLHEKAAAYLFHLTKNHPFIDGNKRVGLAVCLTFLALNGVWVQATEDELVGLVLETVSGERSKADIAVFLRVASSTPRE